MRTETVTGQAWRVQPAWPPSHAVVVDAWATLPIPAPSNVHRRVDLVAEKVDGGERFYRLVKGSPMCGRPVTPAGWEPVAAVHVVACQPLVLHCNIADV